MLRARWTDDTLRNVIGFAFRDSAGLHPVKAALVRATNGLKGFYNTLTADFSIGDQTTTPLGSTGNYLYARALSSAPQGGAPPYTATWSLSATSGSPMLTAANGGATTFRHSSAVTPTAEGEVTLTITDAAGNTSSITKTVTTG